MYRADDYIPLDAEILEATYTNKGNNLYTIFQHSTVLLIFLRHFGCPSCRETLHDLARANNTLKTLGVKIIFIHLSEESYGKQYLRQYGLGGEEHIADPDMTLYEYFGLQKSGFDQMYNLKVWSRVAEIQSIYNTQVNKALGSGYQMPKVFFIKKGQIVNKYIHRIAADRIDYLKFSQESLQKPLYTPPI